MRQGGVRQGGRTKPRRRGPHRAPAGDVSDGRLVTDSGQAELRAGRRPERTDVSVRVLGAAAVLYPVVAVFAPKAMTVLLVASALLLALDARNRQDLAAALRRPVPVLLAALAAWSLVTAAWAPAPATSVTLWVRVVALTLCGLFALESARKLDAGARRAVTGALAVGGVLFVALFYVEILSGNRIARAVVDWWNWLTPWQSTPLPDAKSLLQPSATLAVFAWPCALAIRARYSMIWAVVFMAAVIFALSGQDMLASQVAFLCALAVFAGACAAPRPAAAAIVAAIALVNAVMFTAAPDIVEALRGGTARIAIAESWQERLYILDFVTGKIAGQPVLGWGFDASRALGQDAPGPFLNNVALPLHPHNLWAQGWLELGLVGLVPLAGLVVVTLTRVAALDAGRVAIAAALGCALAYLVIGNISYGMWQNWWLGVAWLNAGFLAALLPPRADPLKAGDRTERL